MIRTVIDRIRAITPGGLAGLVAAFVVLGLCLFVFVARWVNTSPTQCATCHPRLTQLWSTSLEHPAQKVTCYQCHAGHAELSASINLPAFIRDTFIPERYMASDERLELRCTECHDKMVESDKEQSKLVRINHKAHLEKPIEQSGRQVELGCIDCHMNIAHDKAEETTNRPPMFTCFTGECHAKERNRDRCTVCHYQQLGGIEN